MAKAARGDQGGEKPQAGNCSPPLCPWPGTKPSDRFSADYCAIAVRSLALTSMPRLRKPIMHRRHLNVKLS